MIEYYIELSQRPYYQLSYAERTYVDLFPYLILGIVLIIIIVISAIVAFIKDRKK